MQNASRARARVSGRPGHASRIAARKRTAIADAVARRGGWSSCWCRHRFYHAQLGRFVTRDPIGYAGGSLSLYQYVRSRVLIWVDPSGLAECGKCPSGGDSPPDGQFAQFGDVTVTEDPEGDPIYWWPDGTTTNQWGFPCKIASDGYCYRIDIRVLYAPPVPSNFSMMLEGGLCFVGGKILTCRPRRAPLPPRTIDPWVDPEILPRSRTIPNPEPRGFGREWIDLDGPLGPNLPDTPPFPRGGSSTGSCPPRTPSPGSTSPSVP